jgi:hypothetical protein
MLKSALCATCLCALLPGATLEAAWAAEATPAEAAAADDSQAHGFDFLMGTWSVQNRFLAKRMQHSHEWLTFQATGIEQPLRTDTGNMEYYLTSHWPDFIGMALRLYDPRAHKWTIYWSDNRFSRGVLQPPLTGSFHGPIGVFEGADHFGSLPITVRFTWHVIDRDHAQWSQAFSSDHGRSWETNWTMEFTRISENANATSLSGAQHAAHR